MNVKLHFLCRYFVVCISKITHSYGPTLLNKKVWTVEENTKEYNEIQLATLQKISNNKTWVYLLLEEAHQKKLSSSQLCNKCLYKGVWRIYPDLVHLPALDVQGGK